MVDHLSSFELTHRDHLSAPGWRGIGAVWRRECRGASVRGWRRPRRRPRSKVAAEVWRRCGIGVAGAGGIEMYRAVRRTTKG